MHKTLHVNLWGGPSMGKTGVAQLVSGELKRRGYQADYVPEFAKELVRAGTIHLHDQLEILAEQHRREKLNEGLLHVMVCDSPLPISLYHCKPEDVEVFEKVIDNRMNGWRVVNYMLERDLRASYEQEGRYENVDEALAKHDALKQILARRDPGYVSLDTVGAVDIIVKAVVAMLQSDVRVAETA